MKGHIILLIVLFASSVYAEESIYDYIKGMDENYAVVVGSLGSSSDSVGATEIVLSLETNRFLDIQVKLETDVLPEESNVLIGHPCKNSLIDLPCDEWPYDDGQALVKVIGNHLIISGTTDQDTMYAAEIIAQYMNYPIFKETSAVIISKAFLLSLNTTLIRAKQAHEFVCGDTMCEPGEKYLCFSDCKQQTCYQVCEQNDFIDASCQKPPSNPNVAACAEGWSNRGFGYCATGKICCCEQAIKEQPAEPPSAESAPSTSEEERSLFRIILDWIKEFFRALF